MKKFILCAAALFILLNLLPTSFASAKETKSYVAKVQTSGVNLCELPNEASALFEIPYSYFVNVHEIVDEYFKVTYHNIDGYVKKDKVKLMEGTPLNAHPNATISLYTGTSLYESPTYSSKEVAAVSSSSNIIYYGEKIGEQVVDSNQWYYASVTTNGIIHYGYILSAIGVRSPFSTNTETFQPVSEDVFLPTESAKFSGLSTGTKIILIVAISVPSILILYFLIKPSKIIQITKTKRKPKKEIKRVRHGDWFEFDESEL